MSNCNTPSLEALKKTLATQAVRSAELPLTQNLEGTETIPIIKNNEDMQIGITTLLKHAESSFFSVEEPMNFTQAISTVSINRRKIGMIVAYRETPTDAFELMQYHGTSLDTAEYRKPANWKQIKTPQSKFAGFFSSKEELEANANASLFSEAVVGTSPNNYELYYLARCGNWKSKGLLAHIPDSRLTSTPAIIIDTVEEQTYSDRAFSDHLGRNIANTYVDKGTFKTIVSEELAKLLPENIHKLFEDSGCCTPPTVEIDLEQLTQSLLTKFRLDNDGFLYIGSTKLEPSLKGPQGPQGNPGTNGNTTQGPKGDKGDIGNTGARGNDGRTPEFRVVNNKLQIKYTDEPNTAWRDLYTLPTQGTNQPDTQPQPQPQPQPITKRTISYTKNDQHIAIVGTLPTEVNDGSKLTFTLKNKEGFEIYEVTIDGQVVQPTISNDNLVYTSANPITKNTAVVIKSRAKQVTPPPTPQPTDKGFIELAGSITGEGLTRTSNTELRVANRCYTDGTGGSFTIEIPINQAKELLHSFEVTPTIPTNAVTVELTNNNTMARITFNCQLLRNIQNLIIKLKDRLGRFISVILGEAKTPEPVQPTHYNLTIKYTGSHSIDPKQTVVRVPVNNVHTISVPEGYTKNGDVTKESGNVTINNLNVTVNSDAVVILPVSTIEHVRFEVAGNEGSDYGARVTELNGTPITTAKQIPNEGIKFKVALQEGYSLVDVVEGHLVELEPKNGVYRFIKQDFANRTFVITVTVRKNSTTQPERVTVTIASNNESRGTVSFVDNPANGGGSGVTNPSREITEADITQEINTYENDNISEREDGLDHHYSLHLHTSVNLRNNVNVTNLKIQARLDPTSYTLSTIYNGTMAGDAYKRNNVVIGDRDAYNKVPDPLNIIYIFTLDSGKIISVSKESALKFIQ